MNEKIIQNNIQNDAMFVFESETTPKKYGSTFSKTLLAICKIWNVSDIKSDFSDWNDL